MFRSNFCSLSANDASVVLYSTNVITVQDLVMRLQIHQKLKKHTGCVNTVAFNEAGDTLISGSDDQMVMLWDWDRSSVKLEFHSGHGGNVFQARFMPCTDDRTLVTCAADGEVGVSTFAFLY
jgi:DDB1- and CUL4-associated factor 8